MKDRTKRDIKPPLTLVLGITIAVIIAIIIGLFSGAISLEVSALLFIVVGLFFTLTKFFTEAKDLDTV